MGGSTLPKAWLLPVAVERLHVGALHPFIWGERRPMSISGPSKNIEVGVGVDENGFCLEIGEGK